MKYIIDDLNKGIFDTGNKIEANNPIQALKQLGYTNIKRDYHNTGNIVVRSSRGSYVYNAVIEAESEE